MASLAEMTELDFASQPFCDVVDYLKQRHDVEIQLDPRLLARSDIVGHLVTDKCNDIALLQALEELIAPMGLAVVYRHSVPLIMARPVGPALCVPQLADGQELSPQLASALSEKTELDFADQPLANVVQYLTARHNIPIAIDEEAFRLANRDCDARLTRSIKGIPLRSGLGLLLEPLDMACVAEDEVLVIRPAESTVP